MGENKIDRQWCNLTNGWCHCTWEERMGWEISNICTCLQKLVLYLLFQQRILPPLALTVIMQSFLQLDFSIYLQIHSWQISLHRLIKNPVIKFIVVMLLLVRCFWKLLQWNKINSICIKKHLYGPRANCFLISTRSHYLCYSGEL